MSPRQLLRHPSALIVANAGVQAVIRFGSNILLTHLLAPAAFALVSITMLVMFGVQMISDVGIATMTLRHGPMSDIEQDRMWTMQVSRGIVLAAVVFLLAGPTAHLYGSPELGTVLRVLALYPLLSEAQSLYPVLQLARRNLVPSVTIEIAGKICGTLLAAAYALYSPTVWALVASLLGQVVVSISLGHILARRGLPRFDFNWAFIRDHWAFSRWIQLGSAFTFVAMQLDKAIFPLLYGLHRFGIYGIGATFGLIPAQVTQQWSGNVFYPLVVQALRQGGEAMHALRRIRTTMMLYSGTMALGVMAASPAFFYLLYRPIYHEAARFAALLTANFYFEMTESGLRHFPLVATSPRYEFISVVVRVAAFLALVGGIRLLHLDADAYALAFSLAQAISYLFMLSICRRAGYVRARPDLLISGVVLAGLVVTYAVPRMPASVPVALGELAAVALAGLATFAVIFLKRGLPSLAREPTEEQVEEIARAQEMGASPA